MMSTYLPTVFGENLMDVFDDFDRTFFRGINRPEHVLYGKNAAHMMKTDVKETEEGFFDTFTGTSEKIFLCT